MINNNKETNYEPKGRVKEAVDLSEMDEQELLVLRSKIDALLPVTKLSDLNLERELMLQLRAAQALQTRVLDDANIQANQKAQVMNAVAATIQNLVKMQLEYYTPERLKKIEIALVRTLQSWQPDRVEDFFKRYEEILEGG